MSSLTQPKPKVIVTRLLGDTNMDKIRSADVEASRSFFCPYLTRRADLELIREQVVEWTSDDLCPKEWLLENVKGATGLVCMLTDVVSPSQAEREPEDES